MNAYYSNISVTGMTGTSRRSRTAPSVIGRLLGAIDAALAAMSRARVAQAVRVAVITLCFFGTIGVIGGIEADRLSWPAGFAIVAALAAVECVCLRKLKK